MNHSKRLLRIAEKILADVHFSTQQEFEEYLKNHPNYRENTKFYVNGVQVKAPPREKNNDGDMTDEQKKLHQMAMSEDCYERALVAQNPKTSPKTLDRLSGDDDVRIVVADNPNTPSEILDRLSRDEDDDVRIVVATNENTPSETLDRLSRDENNVVRWGVANNENTSSETLDKLSRDKDYSVRRAVKENPNSQL